MQDLMPSFAIDIFGPSGACQNEELPQLTSSDSITSTTNTPISQASTRGSTTTNQSIISQAPQISTAPQSAKYQPAAQPVSQSLGQPSDTD